jgi:hypothetical protein
MDEDGSQDGSLGLLLGGLAVEVFEVLRLGRLMRGLLDEMFEVLRLGRLQLDVAGTHEVVLMVGSS